MKLKEILRGMPTDFGFRLQVVITALVALAVVWVGIQTGDWTGFVLLIPLALLIPIVAKLPAERPVRRRPGDAGQPGVTGAPGAPGGPGGAGTAAKPRSKDDGRRY